MVSDPEEAAAVEADTTAATAVTGYLSSGNALSVAALGLSI